MKLNRKLVLVLALLVSIAMATTGTLAYLTDTDEAVNVMTLGNVDIEQLENGEDNGFSQGSPLYPAYYEGDYTAGMDVTGAIDKVVTVKNVGPSKAFVRTVFAFEAGNLSADEYQNMIHLDTAVNLVWTGEVVAIDGVNYYLAYYVYPDAVEPGVETGASLVRVVMDKDGGNDLVNSFNGDYKIYATSQAVQFDNLDGLGAEKALEAGFGAITATNNPWVGTSAVIPDEPDLLIASAADLKAFAKAVNEGNTFYGKVVALGADIDLGGAAWTPIGTGKVVGQNIRAHFEGTFDGQGHTISNFKVNANEYAGLFGNVRSANIRNITVENADIRGNHWVGGIAGAGICGRFTNCHVVNSNMVCSIEQTNTGWDNGDKVGGIVGYLTADGGSGYVRNSTVTNTNVEGYRQIGGIAGYAQSTSVKAEVTNCTVFDVTVKQNLGEGKQNYKELSAGELVGPICGDGDTSGIVENNEIFASGVVLPVKDAAALKTALSSVNGAFLTNDIKMESATTAPYGNKYAVKLDGGVIDGNGNELYMECYGDDYGIMTSGGTIKNLTIEEGCRAVMIMYPTQDVILDNVSIGGDGVLYPINTGEPRSEGIDLIVTNSTIKGWTSFGDAIESASFTNVKFEQGTYYNNIYGRVLKPYVNTTITNCSFVEHFNLDLSSLKNGQKVTFTNCTVNGQALTADCVTLPSNDADYDTKLFTVDLPSWASTLTDCIIFK